MSDLRQRIVYKVLSGSRLYGTHTENSDYDYRGIIIPTKEYFLGLKRFEQYQSTESEDFCFYDIRKFFQLALKGNPNILEMLWAPLIDPTEVGLRIQKNRDLFLSKAMIAPHLGMVRSHLKRFRRKFDAGQEPNWKDASNVLRVLRQLTELLQDRTITFPRPEEERQLLTAARHKDIPPKAILFEAEVRQRVISVLENHYDFPKKPDFYAAQDLLISLVDDQLALDYSRGIYRLEELDEESS